MSGKSKFSEKQFTRFGTTVVIEARDSDEVGNHYIELREHGSYYMRNDKYDRYFENWAELEKYLVKEGAEIVGYE